MVQYGTVVLWYCDAPPAVAGAVGCVLFVRADALVAFLQPLGDRVADVGEGVEGQEARGRGRAVGLTKESDGKESSSTGKSTGKFTGKSEK